MVRPTAKPAEGGFSLKQESTRGKKQTHFEATGKGKTPFMFDMKKGDLRGQTTLMDRFGTVPTMGTKRSPKEQAGEHRQTKGTRRERLEEIRNRLEDRRPMAQDRFLKERSKASGEALKTLSFRAAKIRKQLDATAKPKPTPDQMSFKVTPKQAQGRHRSKVETLEAKAAETRRAPIGPGLRERSRQAAQSVAKRAETRKAAEAHRKTKGLRIVRLRNLYRKTLEARDRSIGTPRGARLEALKQSLAHPSAMGGGNAGDLARIHRASRKTVGDPKPATGRYPLKHEKTAKPPAAKPAGATSPTPITPDVEAKLAKPLPGFGPKRKEPGLYAPRTPKQPPKPSTRLVQDAPPAAPRDRTRGNPARTARPADCGGDPKSRQAG